MDKRKVIFTLCVDGYSPEITALTFPLLRYYASKIGARLHIIDERRFTNWPVTVEKLQVYYLARDYNAEWAMFFDADTLIHPETVDFTDFLTKDTVAHNGSDMAAVRWRYDKYFLRDGRNIGACNWCTMASEWCFDLWHPPDDITLEEALDAIRPTVNEQNTVVTTQHLIDDYLLSRNIAKYGLKFTTLMGLQKRIGLSEGCFFWHQYTIPSHEKVKQMKDLIKQWEIPDRIMSYG